MSTLLSQVMTLADYDKLVDEFAQGKRKFVQACSRCSMLEEQYQRDFPGWKAPAAEQFWSGGRLYTMGLCKTCGEIEETDRKNRRAAQDTPPGVVEIRHRTRSRTILQSPLRSLCSTTSNDSNLAQTVAQRQREMGLLMACQPCS
jgi:hypothetical protein